MEYPPSSGKTEPRRTALELEAGTLPVSAAYDRVGREGRPINYGFAASWLFARIAEKEGMEPTGAVTFFQEAQRRTGWQHTLASPDETALVGSWVAECGRRAAWLSPDAENSDPARFLTYLVVALRTIAAEIGVGIVGALQVP